MQHEVQLETRSAHALSGPGTPWSSRTFNHSSLAPLAVVPPLATGLLSLLCPSVSLRCLFFLLPVSFASFSATSASPAAPPPLLLPGGRPSPRTRLRGWPTWRPCWRTAARPRSPQDTRAPRCGWTEREGPLINPVKVRPRRRGCMGQGRRPVLRVELLRLRCRSNCCLDIVHWQAGTHAPANNLVNLPVGTRVATSVHRRMPNPPRPQAATLSPAFSAQQPCTGTPFGPALCVAGLMTCVLSPCCQCRARPARRTCRPPPPRSPLLPPARQCPARAGRLCSNCSRPTRRPA